MREANLIGAAKGGNGQRDIANLREVQIAAQKLVEPIIAVLDRDGIIQSANGAWPWIPVLNGRKADQLGIGLSYLNVFQSFNGQSDEDTTIVVEGIQSVLDGSNSSFSFEYETTVQEQKRWFQLHVSALSGAAGDVVVSLVDVTEQKRTQEALQEQEERYRKLLSVLPAAVYTCDNDGVIDYYNQRAGELWGRTPKIGDTDEKFCGSYRLYYPDGRPLPHHETPMALAVFEAKPTYDGEVVIERPDGSLITVNVNIVPLFNKEGEHVGAINVFQDVTERKRLLEEIRRERELLRQIVEQAPASIAFLEGPEHRFTLVNPAYRTFARGKGEPVGRTVAEVWPEAAEVVVPLLDKVYQEDEVIQGQEMPVPVERENGLEMAYFTFSMVPMPKADNRVKGILVVGVETTEHVAAREQIETERALLEAVVTQMPSGVAIVDAPSGRLHMSNEHVSRILRRPAIPTNRIEEYSVYRGFHPDGRPYKPEEWPIARSIMNGEVVEDEEILCQRGDETYVVLNVSSAPVYDKEGQIKAGVVIFSDITERKNAEADREHLLGALEKERAQLKELTETLEERVLERTAQVRDLASALSLAEQRERVRISQILHDDLQQLLYSQLMRLEILRHQLATTDKQISVDDLVTGMIEQLDQAVHATRALAAELNPPEMESDDLCEALEWLVKHMEDNHRLQITFTADGSGEISQSETRNLLLQIVRELLFNVVKHARTDQARLELRRDNGFLVIDVADDGVGFDVDKLSTGTKKRGGTGLLSIADRLELLGGRLEITSIPRSGTRMTIFAPVG